ncbi:hypothetical protein BESB_051660 [Besnoitia besnoiti]|uniref:Thrombospondin type 1 domain-containing protein n=1 Tax=Besnoitia besnoiti TaxID=94643 RepID=A0A2A9MC12_BESBE|nr:hypothetical protein BESB_051660 [Besnoitia besnoiti]PFH35515.1 hypothetical protein BESB_051660 [Besnoitia besnoiti]
MAQRVVISRQCRPLQKQSNFENRPLKNPCRTGAVGRIGFLFLFCLIQDNAERPLLACLSCAKGFAFHCHQSYTLLPVQATIQLETSSVLLGMPISTARRKVPFARNAYENVTNHNGIPQVEPIVSHHREDGSFQVVYNSCPEADSHKDDADLGIPSPPGCIGRLVSFTAEGKQIGGEKNLDFRTLLTEARIVGYWSPLTEPVDGHNDLRGALFAVWALKCPTVESTCECTAAKCRITLETASAKSGYLLFVRQSIFETYEGDRVCLNQESLGGPIAKGSSAKFTFWLVHNTGWECGREDMRGAFIEFDEQHPEGIRVGSVFAVRQTKSNPEEFQVVRTVWNRARLEYNFGFNALTGGLGKLMNSRSETEKVFLYAFIIRAKSFDAALGISQARCFGVLLDSDLQESGDAGAALPCRPCGYAAFLLHPQYQELMAVCEDTSRNSSRYYVDGKPLLGTNNSVQFTNPTAKGSPVFVPDDFRAWKVLWKGATAESLRSAQTPQAVQSVHLGEWNQELQTFFRNTSPVEGINTAGADAIFASFFGEDSLLVGYQDSTARSSYLLECFSNGTRVPGQFLKILRSAEASLLPAAAATFIPRRRATGEVIWFSLWNEDRVSHDLQNSFLPIAQSTQELRIVKVTGSRDEARPCRGGIGPDSPTCNASCHSLQVYETNKTVGSDDDPACAYEDSTNFAEVCYEGDCPLLPVVITRASGAVQGEKVDGRAGDSLAVSSQPPSAFEVSLQRPAEIWAIRSFFVPQGHTEFNVTLMDPKRTVIYTLPTSLPPLKTRNLTFWEWRDMQVYRVQYIRVDVVQKQMRESDSLELADIHVLGRELPLCPPEAFFSSGGPACAYNMEFILKEPTVWDCQGEWSEWSYCDSTCRSTRFLNVRQPALYGGRPCPSFEKKACNAPAGLRRCHLGMVRVPQLPPPQDPPQDTGSCG